MNAIKTHPPGQVLRGLALALVLPCALTGCARPQPAVSVSPAPPPTIRLAEDRGSIEVAGIDPATYDWLAARPADAVASLAVYANRRSLEETDSTPRMAGRWEMTAPQRILRFTPAYPLLPGIPYLVAFQPPPGPHSTATLLIPKPQSAPTIVEQVFPTASVLPENQLKFYIHFSGPMGRGEAYEHIKLLDSDGKVIEAVFLELGEELWDAANRRFTLLFDPGRIKHGLKPREDLGPTLENGKSYTLVIDSKWTDANGNPLKEGFRKSIKAGPPVEKAVDPQTWKVVPPAAPNEPLTVSFPVPMEHALLHRELWVTDPAGKRMAGAVQVSDEEKRWQFTPAAAWTPGAYKLVAKTTLEDLAGNRIGRLFEVDVFQKIDREIKAETVELPFAVK